MGQADQNKQYSVHFSSTCCLINPKHKHNQDHWDRFDNRSKNDGSGTLKEIKLGLIWNFILFYFVFLRMIAYVQTENAFFLLYMLFPKTAA